MSTMKSLPVPKECLSLLLADKGPYTISGIQKALNSKVAVTCEVENGESPVWNIHFEDETKLDIVKKHLEKLQQLSEERKNKGIFSLAMVAEDAEWIGEKELREIRKDSKAVVECKATEKGYRILRVSGSPKQFYQVQQALQCMSATPALGSLHQSINKTLGPVTEWAKLANQCQSLAIIDRAFKREPKPDNPSRKVTLNYEVVLDSMVEPGTTSLKMTEPYFEGTNIVEMLRFCKFALRRAHNIKLSMILGSAKQYSLACFWDDLEKERSAIKEEYGTNPELEIFVNTPKKSDDSDKEGLHDRFLIADGPSGKLAANTGRGFNGFSQHSETKERKQEEQIVRVNVVKREKADDYGNEDFDSLFDEMKVRSSKYLR